MSIFIFCAIKVSFTLKLKILFHAKTQREAKAQRRLIFAPLREIKFLKTEVVGLPLDLFLPTLKSL
jgi:hypothetical protein